MPDQVTISYRFRGPIESGNGGYSCGALARRLGSGPAEVTLRLPPPLERPLDIGAGGDGVELRDGEALVAEARPVDALELETPSPIGVEEAKAARHASPLHQHHPFEECFVCGPAREPGATCVAVGWPIDREGRKLRAGSAVFSAGGELLALARATWIELKA